MIDPGSKKISSKSQLQNIRILTAPTKEYMHICMPCKQRSYRSSHICTRPPAPTKELACMHCKNANMPSHLDLQIDPESRSCCRKTYSKDSLTAHA